MQSSVRSVTPRLVTISATPSSTSLPRDGAVQVDREVTVTSRIRTPPKPATYSAMPPTTTNSHTQSRDLSWSQSSRRDDFSRMSTRSTRSAGHESRYSYPPLAASEVVMLESNRESMRALAEFLRTKDPPPNNWVSFQSDDEVDYKSHKLSALQVFSRKKKKKGPKFTRLLKLPDSAVAATTREGFRHIAISIPLEHDFLDAPRASFHPATRYHPLSKSHTIDRPERTAVTVLKPVVELRESISSYLPQTADSQAPDNSIKPRPASVATPPAVILGPEATRTLENYYTQLNIQQRQSNPEGKKPETARPARSYVRVPPTDFTHDSQRGVQRSSNGTAYSNISLTTAPGHSRGVSSTSTAPSFTQQSQRLRVELPPRKSSRSTNPRSLEAELKRNFERTVATEEAECDILKSTSGNESVVSGRSASQSPPTVFAIATAKTARSYSAVGPQLFRSRTPQASGSTTAKQVPALPVRSATAPPSSDAKIIPLPLTGRETADIADVSPISQNSRQERVKARKQRDLEALRTKGLSPFSISGRTAEQALQQTGGLRESKYPESKPHMSSKDQIVEQAVNTISTIMIVANLVPLVGAVSLTDLPSPPSRSSIRMAPSSNSNTVRTYTPPQSMNESFSDSDTIPRTPSQPASSKRGSPVRSMRSAALDTRRQERRAKRNTVLHEKELDARLSKIERDNAMLITTLSSIANSFGQLNRLVPGARLPSGLIAGLPRASGKDIQRMEPVMRGSQYVVPKFSGESLRKARADDFDDDFGA